jgi:secreted trypsin-like serine protease
MSPFILGFTEVDGVVNVRDYKEWLEKTANFTLDEKKCAVKYNKMREYEDAIIQNGNEDYRGIQYGKSHISEDKLNDYKVQIGWKNGDKDLWKCGGVLLRENFVLTVASCLDRHGYFASN